MTSKHCGINADNLFIRELTPGDTPLGAFVLLHGMESHSGWFMDCAARLVRNGWAVIAFDRAGWGKSPGPRGHMESYTDFVESVAKIAVQARRKYGAVHLAGMSWGGMASLYLALRRGWLFDSVTLLAPGLAAQRDITAGGKARLVCDFLLREFDNTVEPVFEVEHFTRDPQWREFIADDPDRVTAVTASFCFETLKMRRFIQENAGRRLTPPTLCLLAGEDDIIDNQVAGAVCRKAGALIEYIPRASHTLVFEKPAQISGILDHHARHAVPAPGTSGGRAWVVGAGAVGGAVASLLSFGGVNTGVLVKPSHLPSLRESGITLRCGNAFRTTDTLHFADTPGGLPTRPDVIVFAVKSFDTPAVLKQLTGLIPPSSVIVSLQNGVGNEDRIACAFPENTVIAASICASLELDRPGYVVWADDRGGLAGAVHQGDEKNARTVWESIMTRTGMECRWIDGMDASERLKWSKLMLNTGFNALNSITGMSSSALLADPVFGSLAVNALREGFAVMNAMQLYPVDLPGFPVSKLRLLLKLPVAAARRIMSWQAGRSPEAAFSMRQDVLKKRQYTEIDELNGRIAESGALRGVPTLANAKLVQMVKEFR